METSNTEIAPAAARPADSFGSAKNHTHNHDHHHLSSSDQPHIHPRGILSFHSVIIIVVSTISVIVLLALFLLIIMFRRLKSSKDSHGSSFKDVHSSSINHSGSSRFAAHTAINVTSSPGKQITNKHHFVPSYSQIPGKFLVWVCSKNVADVKGGCLYGGPLRSNIPTTTNKIRHKGVQVFTYKELEMATDKFSEANVIGNGGIGVVYKGVMSDGTVAAIKKLRRDGKQGERAFRMEVDLLSRLHSPYLVELLGYCADQNHRLLISEFMPHGTLQHRLHHPNNQYQPLDWGTRLIIVLDCARGLEFLHEQAIPPVIHRDFNCSNVLLDQNFRAKVTDFGLAKMVSDKTNGQISTRVLGTTGYLAPEYASTGKLTTKSDVYSYGVVLLELLTGRVPVDTNRPPGEHVLVSWALPRLTNREKVVEMVDPSLQGQYSKKDLIQIAAIAAMCVQPEADYRPLMTDVVQSLIPLVKNNASVMPLGSARFQHQTPSPSH